jgi:hypothetical protein
MESNPSVLYEVPATVHSPIAHRKGKGRSSYAKEGLFLFPFSKGKPRSKAAAFAYIRKVCWRESIATILMKAHTEYGAAGPESTKIVHKPKDQYFRTRSEGRADTQRAKRARPVKFREVIYSQRDLVFLFRSHVRHADHTRWICNLSNPKRKMTASDQLEIMLAPELTRYRVEIETVKKYLIIHNLKGEEL